MTKVSICIPVYNQVKYLKQTIDSVLNQSFTDYEIIITDDYLNDIFINLIKKYQLKTKIQYYKNAVALGSPENWNEAIRLSKGEYIKIMHHDDYFSDENALYEFVRMLDENPNANFAFSTTNVIEVQKSMTRIHSPTNEQIINLKKNPYILFFGNFVGPPSSVIHRRMVDIVYDKNLKWVVDFDFYIRSLVFNGSFVFINKPLINNISGDFHNVTLLCHNVKDVEIFEYLYLFNKISKNQKKFFLNKAYIVFFKKLFLKYKILSIRDIRDASYHGEIPFFLRVLVLVLSIRMFLLKMKRRLC